MKTNIDHHDNDDENEEDSGLSDFDLELEDDLGKDTTKVNNML
jgi:hypothetical protein